MKLVYTLLFWLLVGLCGTSCAHKSGHKPKRQPTAKTPSEVVESTPIPETDGSQRSLMVPKSDNRGNRPKLDGIEIFSKYNTAVFMIYTTDGYNNYQGSGFFINDHGLAISNYHVFQGTNIGGEQIKLADNDEPYKVIEVIRRNEDEDFILFRVNASNTNYIPIARIRPKVGEKVYAIGSPRGLENTFSSGEVSQWRDRNLMQISALIDHGSSGGALINEYGEAVGITSGSFADGSQANLNYAWSIDVIKPFVNQE